MRLKNPQDVLAGLLFAAFGGAALYFGQSYSFGSATRMGPGYLPTVLGWALIGIGAFITLRSFAISGAPIPRIDIRPQFFIIAAVIAFAFTIERFGLLVAAASVVVLGSFASREMRWTEMVIVAVCASLAAVGLFIHLLGQPMTPWVWDAWVWSN